MICTKCREDKDEEEDFHRLRDGRFPWCKDCRRDYDRGYHKKRWESGIKAKQIAVRLERNRELIWKHLTTHWCNGCGETDPVVLEFNHLGDKRGNVSDMVRWASVKTLREEIEKCEVLCANCHRRKTAEQFGFYTWV